MASSLKSAKKMLRDLVCEAAKFGLDVHESKTKVLWNGQGDGTNAKRFTINSRQFEILGDSDSTMYLCRLFSFKDHHDTELKHRVRKAWAKFGVFRNELTNKCYDLWKRVRLFKSVVQPSFLYGCVSWTLTRAREKLIQTTQRKMLRQILGVKRLVDDEGVLEEWVDWMVRSTGLAEKMAEDLDVPDWTVEVHRRRYQWAAQVCRRQDERWTLQALTWSVNRSRRRGRPLSRWTDSFFKFFDIVSPHEYIHNVNTSRHICWMTFAQDEVAWDNLEEDYLNFVLGRWFSPGPSPGPVVEPLCTSLRVMRVDRTRLSVSVSVLHNFVARNG